MEFDIRDTNAARLLGTLVTQNHSIILLLNRMVAALENRNLLTRPTEPPQPLYNNSTRGRMPWQDE